MLALNGNEWSASRPPSFYPQVRNPWYPLNRKLGGSFWLDILEKLKVLYRYSNFNPWFVRPVVSFLYLLHCPGTITLVPVMNNIKELKNQMTNCTKET